MTGMFPHCACAQASSEIITNVPALFCPCFLVHSSLFRCCSGSFKSSSSKLCCCLRPFVTHALPDPKADSLGQAHVLCLFVTGTCQEHTSLYKISHHLCYNRFTCNEGPWVERLVYVCTHTQTHRHIQTHTPSKEGHTQGTDKPVTWLRGTEKHQVDHH